MSIVRRSLIPAAAAVIVAVVGAPGAIADTGPRPLGGDPVSSDPIDLGRLIGLGIVTALVVLVAMVSTRRPAWRRPIAALLTVAVTGFLALGLIGVAMFSDFSGRHDVYVQPLIAGFVVLVVGLVVAAAIVIGGRGSPANG
jgi:ABC-type Na+ efflux pump permease subunit